jgi:hypothetical protein
MGSKSSSLIIGAESKIKMVEGVVKNSQTVTLNINKGTSGHASPQYSHFPPKLFKFVE